jgi:hypothetical protein
LLEKHHAVSDIAKHMLDFSHIKVATARGFVVINIYFQNGQDTRP